MHFSFAVGIAIVGGLIVVWMLLDWLRDFIMSWPFEE